MKVHHLNCLTMCPLGGPLVGARGWFDRGELCCHVLLIETPQSGLVLVDTAIGIDDCEDPAGRLGTGFAKVALPRPPDPARVALSQIEALGLDPNDVRNIIVTHLDLDHAGGLPDFPKARVHLLAAERDAALAPQGFRERERYRRAHLAHGPNWQTYTPTGETWRGFDAVKQLVDLPPEILLIPLSGHSRGHACVAVETSQGALVHCGDAYFHRNAMNPSDGPVPAGLRFFESSAAVDMPKIATNHARLRELSASDGVQVFCAHDPVEYARLAEAADG